MINNKQNSTNNKTRKVKGLAVFIGLALFIGLLPTTAWATEEPQGTSSKPSDLPVVQTLDDFPFPLHTNSEDFSTMLKRNCGFTSCSLYFSRSQTRAIYNEIEISGIPSGLGAVALCTKIGVSSGSVGGAVCSMMFIVLGGLVQRSIRKAVEGNKCLKVSFTNPWVVPSPPGPIIPGTVGYPVPTSVSTNNGKYCKN